MILSTEQIAKTSICVHNGTSVNDTIMEQNAPRAKQVRKKSPEPSSIIRHIMAMAVHIAQRLDAKYAVMVYIFIV